MRESSGVSYQRHEFPRGQGVGKSFEWFRLAGRFAGKRIQT